VEQNLNLFRNHQVQIIWGGRDFCFNDYFLARWRQIFPQASAERIPDAGHYVLEDAGDDALGLAEGFLQGK
jgi:haloalkane dehalogenase